MFEAMTYEKILTDMLNRIPDTFDKREGSIIFDALAPTAVQLAETYIDLDLIIEESFADTASRPYLILRCKERGIYPIPATNAIVKMEFNKDVPIGSRFSFDKWNFRVDEKIEPNIYKAYCEETGHIFGTGDAIPIEAIEGLEFARVTEILINGEEEESTDSLRVRYFNSFTTQSFGGNRADYKERVPQLQDVGAIKVKRITEKDPNIRITIINSTFDGASAELVESVQTTVDPTINSGEGYGIAPIGHHVKVDGVVPKTINVETTFTFLEGYSFEDLRTALEQAFKSYVESLNVTWANIPNGLGLTVRISQIEAKFLDIDGVLDVQNTKINDLSDNIHLNENEIVKVGVLTNA